MKNAKYIPLEALAEVKVGYAFPSSKFVEDPKFPKLLRGINVKRGHIAWGKNIEANWGGDERGLDEYLLRPGDLVVAMDGALVGRSYGTVSESDLPAYLVQRVARIRARNPRSQSYLRHLVGSRLFERFVDRVKTHTAVPHISGTDIKAFRSVYISEMDQERIGSTFDGFIKVEQQIRTLIALKSELIRGVAKQLLFGRKRFQEFKSDAWRSSSLGLHVKRVLRKNHNGCRFILTASGEHGLVDQRRYFNRSVAGADVSKYYLLKRGEFAYNRSAMKDYPYGATKRLDKHEEGALSTLYLCFAISDPQLDSDFLRHVFESGILNRQLRPLVRVGARAHGLLSVSDDDFLSVSIPFPELREQQRIAEVLNGLEREIELLGLLREHFEIYKRGLLDRCLCDGMPATA